MTGKIEFQVNMQRMLETVCWFANQAGKEGTTAHTIMKLLFFADVGHINKYYIPIIGGHYVAMKFGPVHSELYDTLKDNYPPIFEAGAELPFEVKGHHIIATREPNEDKFSKASLNYLNIAWQNHSGKSFMELTSLSHEHEAWKKAWQGSFLENKAMDYEDFFDHKVDEDILEDLHTYGKAIAV